MPTARRKRARRKLGVDAVEQFTVLTSNYPGTGRPVFWRSGRCFHAVGNEQFPWRCIRVPAKQCAGRAEFLDSAKPPFRRNQFGASAGGPLWKNRTFLFGDYEGLRASTGITQVDTYLRRQRKAGNLSTGGVAVDPSVLRFMNAFFHCQTRAF